MSPQEQLKMDELEKKVDMLMAVEDVSFIENIKRRLFGNKDVIAKEATDDDVTNLTVGGAASSAKPFDRHISFVDDNQDRYYIGVYDSV